MYKKWLLSTPFLVALSLQSIENELKELTGQLRMLEEVVSQKGLSVLKREYEEIKAKEAKNNKLALELFYKRKDDPTYQALISERQDLVLNVMKDASGNHEKLQEWRLDSLTFRPDTEKNLGRQQELKEELQRIKAAKKRVKEIDNSIEAMDISKKIKALSSSVDELLRLEALKTQIIAQDPSYIFPDTD